MKIKQCSEAEAERTFGETPMGFNDAMKSLLGSGGALTGEVDEDNPDAFCVLTPELQQKMGIEKWRVL